MPIDRREFLAGTAGVVTCGATALREYNRAVP